jgi:hypothetical protein
MIKSKPDLRYSHMTSTSPARKELKERKEGKEKSQHELGSAKPELLRTARL